MLTDSDDNNKLTHTRNLGDKQFIEYLKSEPIISQLIFSIEKYLQNQDAFYYLSILRINKGYSLETIKQNLKQQYANLTNKKSFYHKINNAIKSRQKCIQKLKQKLSKLQQILKCFKKVYYKNNESDNLLIHYTQIEGYSHVDIQYTIDESIKSINSMFVDMSRLRDITIYIIQEIHQWKYKIQQKMDRCGQHQPIYYIYQGQNYYHRLQRDIKFIWESKLSEYILFEDKLDPLIIRNVVNLEQKSQKQVLEKYFVEILYPQNQQIVDKSIRCLQMLVYKYQTKTTNMFQQEQMLIENYLSLERRKLEESGIRDQQKNNQQNPQKKVKDSKGIMHIKGSMFGKNIQKPVKSKIKQIIEKHQNYMQIKPFSIKNYDQKKSIAYSSKQPKISDSVKRIIINNRKKIKNFQQNHGNRNFIYGDQVEILSDNDNTNIKQKQMVNQDLRNSSTARMFQSLTKIAPIIYQDPNESQPQTPKKRQKHILNRKYESTGRQHSKNNIKINTFEEKDRNQSGIQIDSQQTPLNMKQFLQVFRADTEKKSIKKSTPTKKSRLRIYSISSLIKKRSESMKNLPFLKKYKKPSNIKKIKKSIQKLKQSLNNSYQSYIKVQNQDNPENVQAIHEQFISLKSKRIPFDMIGMYLRHIFSLQPSTCLSFTQYNILQVQKILQNPEIQCFIFDLHAENKGHIGQVILSESLGSRRGLLKYKIQFINVLTFQLMINSIARIAQQLLSSTPCQQFVCNFVVDKNDTVSTHFIELIDNALKLKSQKFCLFHILEKKKLSYKDKDMYQRLYIFNNKKIRKSEQVLVQKMMGNYRSITIDIKSLLLSSNFILRSKNLQRSIISNYHNTAIGSLYVRVFEHIITKYHLKQIKTASMSLNDSDQMVSLVKNSPFLRSIIYELLTYIKDKDNKNLDFVSITKFTSMLQLINYLNYKEYDYYFHFQFLEESKFILNHQLILSQYNSSISLQFMVTSSPDFLLLGNHRNLSFQAFSKRQQPNIVCYLIPTTQTNRKLLIMNGNYYEDQTTDQLDLYSYLITFFRNQNQVKQVNDIPQIVIPNITNKNKKFNKVKMYDGLFRLFPQRQFYTCSMLNVINHWQGYYPSAIVRLPDPSAIIIQYPLIIGFYNCALNQPQVCYLLKQQQVHV